MSRSGKMSEPKVFKSFEEARKAVIAEGAELAEKPTSKVLSQIFYRRSRAHAGGWLFTVIFFDPDHARRWVRAPWTESPQGPSKKAKPAHRHYGNDLRRQTSVGWIPARSREGRPDAILVEKDEHGRQFIRLDGKIVGVPHGEKIYDTMIGAERAARSRFTRAVRSAALR